MTRANNVPTERKNNSKRGWDEIITKPANIDATTFTSTNRRGCPDIEGNAKRFESGGDALAEAYTGANDVARS